MTVLVYIQCAAVHLCRMAPSWNLVIASLIVASCALNCYGRDCSPSEGREDKVHSSVHVNGVTSCDSPDREANDPRDRCEQFGREISTTVLSANNIVCPGSQKTFVNFQISNLVNKKNPITGVRSCSADYDFDCCFRYCFNNNPTTQSQEQLA